jgi:hypothetical protein
MKPGRPRDYKRPFFLLYRGDQQELTFRLDGKNGLLKTADGLQPFMAVDLAQPHETASTPAPPPPRNACPEWNLFSEIDVELAAREDIWDDLCEFPGLQPNWRWPDNLSLDVTSPSELPFRRL